LDLKVQTRRKGITNEFEFLDNTRLGLKKLPKNKTTFPTLFYEKLLCCSMEKVFLSGVTEVALRDPG